ncbi:MAG: hypothetical protein J6B02_05595 [Selenomonadales bacterium]|nr:hypothetical protein [Selenomonadales bacterium]
MSNKAFSLPYRTETQDKDGLMVKYNDARNQEATSLLRDPAPQEARIIQDTRANSTDDMLVSAKRRLGDNNDSLTLQDNEKMRFDQDSVPESGESPFDSQEYSKNISGLSTGANTFFDWISKGVRDFVQSDVGRSASVSGMDDWPSKEDWRSGLEAIKQTNVRQLTEAAAKIMGILSIVAGGAEIAALNITLGLCVVAQEVQEERRKEKERLEGLNDPKWDEPAIKAELERQVPIWFRNKAMEFFAGEWLGKIAKFITNDKVGGIVIDQSREPFLEWYKRMLKGWEEYDKTMDAESRIDSWTKIIKEEYKE